MKYRILSKEELSHFEEELKQFLIVNHLDGDSWKQLNESDPDKAIAVVEVFSDEILERVYSKINFLEFGKKDSCIVFKCGETSLELISVVAKEGATCDLTTPAQIHAAFLHHLGELSYFVSSKKYVKSRNEEIHDLIESGCILSSKEFWDALKKVIDTAEVDE